MNQHPGLEGVVVAETRMSDIDGAAGRLIIAGQPVEALGGLTVEDIAARLWSRVTPPALEESDPAALARAFHAGRAAAFEQLPRLGAALEHEDGMVALRAAMAQLDPDSGGAAPALVGAVAVYAAAWWRRRQGLAPVPPSAVGHAADYLRMLTGRAPDEDAVAAMRTYLVTVSDHGMNASTFAARVVTSTGSDPVSAVVAAIGALKGPLHGGAPGPVLDLLDAVGRPERAPAVIAAELAAGRRIMGMGHRVYRVRDPRAEVLAAAARRLGGPRVELAGVVEAEAGAQLSARHPDRPLRANVELYTAVLLDALGIDRACFSPTFAVGRVIGWLGHIAEQRATGRLLRPRARYVG